MPLMTSPDGRQRIVPDASVGWYRELGWSAGDVPPAPSPADRKDDWVAYAVTRGYDPDQGLTKAELIEAYGDG